MAKGREKSRYLNALKSEGAPKTLVDAFAGVDREIFFDPIFADRIYAMEPIPIGSGQKSEPPLVLAKMLSHLPLRKKGRVLEVGTGSGYSTAVLSHLAKELVTIEYHEDLARSAKERLIGRGFPVSRFFAGDATDFDGPLGEFDAVIVFAACMRTPFFLINALRPGGVAVFPMGPAHQQQIARFVNDPDARQSADNFRFFDYCTFDSIRGVYGWVDLPDVPSNDGEEPVDKG